MHNLLPGGLVRKGKVHANHLGLTKPFSTRKNENNFASIHKKINFRGDFCTKTTWKEPIFILKDFFKAMGLYLSSYFNHVGSQ
jgi:hypothetical protein